MDTRDTQPEPPGQPASAITCEHVVALAGDAADDRLDVQVRERVERHLAACASCRSLVQDLRTIRQGAAALPAHGPGPKVWARIESELQARQPAPVRPPALHAPFWTGWRVGLAMAAVALMAVVATVILMRVPDGMHPSAGQAAWQPAGPAAHQLAEDTVKEVDEHLRIADANYQQAITALEKVVAAEQASLDPAVAATLQKNLGIIDKAIQESRAAIASQPNSQLAQTSLFETLKQKVSLLEDTIALINTMRKGDQAGAARIIGGLRKS